MKLYPLFFILLFSVPQYSFSQSNFLLRGQSGFGGGVGVNMNREMSGFLLYAGYSYSGFLDGNLLYSKTSGGDIAGGILSPRMTYYPIKQEDAEGAPTIGLSLAFSAYSKTTTTTNAVPDSGVATYHYETILNTVNVNAITAEVTVQRRTGYWKVFFFQPSLGASMLMAGSGWKFTLRGGVDIGTRIVHGPLIFVTPSIELQSGLTSLVVILGAVF